MKRIIMVGNTHFDPVWLWRWDEAMASISATFRSALDRMNENENFCYSFSAPAVFEWIENTDPDMFEEIKQRVEEGRWELGEGWWLQTDCNALSGESMVRHGLYSQRYLLDKFGKMSETVFNIDSFGHSAQIPQIMKGCGLKNYCFWRPNEEHKPLPQALFKWTGIDGSSVKCYRVGGTGGEIFTQDFEKHTFEKIFEENTAHDLLVVFGVTDHGGAPTKAQMKIIDRLSEERDDCVIKYGTVEEYFAGVNDMPEVKDELQVKFIGPYSNFTEIKKNNRIAEYALQKAETASVIADKLLKREYPASKLRDAWKDVMFNQFHDILGGACIKSAYFDARNLHGRAIQSANEVMHYALQAITRKIKMPGKNPDNEWNVVVWNLNGVSGKYPVEAEVQWAWEFPWYNGGIELVDSEGNVYPCQIIHEECVVPSFRSRFVFLCDMPSFGYRSFIVRKTERSSGAVSRFEYEALDNGGFNITDTKTGKKAENVFVPYALGDICDTWGFNKTVYEDEKEYFSIKERKVTEDGIVRKTVRTVLEFGKSVLEQNVSFYEDFVECSYRVLWNEEKKALKMGFEASKCTASIPYGYIEREKCEFERPVSEWMKTENYGLSFDSSFAYRFDDNNIGVTLLRNCIFGDLRTKELDATRDYSYMGQGETSGKIRLSFENIENIAVNHNNTPVVIDEANHDGVFPADNSFFECSGARISAVKQSEDGTAVIFRAVEESGEDSVMNISVGDKTAAFDISAFEIKTLKFDGEFKIVNMLEE